MISWIITLIIYPIATITAIYGYFSDKADKSVDVEGSAEFLALVDAITAVCDASVPVNLTDIEYLYIQYRDNPEHAEKRAVSYLNNIGISPNKRGLTL